MKSIEFPLQCECCGETDYWEWNRDKLYCSNCGYIPEPYILNGNESNYFLDNYCGIKFEIPHFKFIPEGEITIQRQSGKGEIIYYKVSREQIREYEKYLESGKGHPPITSTRKRKE